MPAQKKQNSESIDWILPVKSARIHIRKETPWKEKFSHEIKALLLLFF